MSTTVEVKLTQDDNKNLPVMGDLYKRINSGAIGMLTQVGNGLYDIIMLNDDTGNRYFDPQEKARMPMLLASEGWVRINNAKITITN